MKLNLYILLIFFLGLFMFCSNNNIGKESSIDPVLGFSTGPDVSEKIPEFSLPDQNGNMKSLKDIIGKNGAVLNFYRSASW